MAQTPFRLKVPATPLSQRTPFRQPLFGLPSTTPLRASATPFRKPLATPFQQMPARTPYRQTSATPFRQTSATPFRQSVVQFRQPSATPFRQLASATPWRPGNTLRSSVNGHMFKTPVRPGAMAYNPPGTVGLSVGTGTETGTARQTRAVTEVEALRQVLASARKRVYHGGGASESSKDLSEASGRVGMASGRNSRASGRVSQASGRISQSEIRNQEPGQDFTKSGAGAARSPLPPLVIPPFELSVTSSDDVPGPPSPSPSPRPGSALSRRSATPSVMLAFGAATPSGMYSRSGSRLSVRATTPTWQGRTPRRDESDEDEESETEQERKERRERVDRERREKVERERKKAEQERKAILEKEEARKEEIARLERQKAKGKGREMEKVPEAEARFAKEREQGRRSNDRDQAGQKVLHNPAQHDTENRHQDLGGKAPEHQVRTRRKPEKSESRRRGEVDQTVEAARMHELRLAEEMARRDEAKRAMQGRGRTDGPQEQDGERHEPGEADAPPHRFTNDPTGRRRIKSADEAISPNVAELASQSLPRDRRRDQPKQHPPEQALHPPSRTRTRSHNDPLISSTADAEKPRPAPRVSLDDVAVRQKRLANDVDALESRIRDVLRALQAGQT
ncbi:hypothetical protein FRC12_013272 [Ceratobasidium sp. 428]|nr:hypothetical protein FRC12_013272 [Ceratobasidium sp. 428]